MTWLRAAVVRCYPQLAVVLFLTGAIIVALLTAPGANAQTLTATGQPVVLCVHRSILYDTRFPGYRIDDDAFAGYQRRYCIRATTTHSFTTLNNARASRHGTVVAYPKVYIGQNYTSGDPESQLPRPVSALGRLTLHVRCAGHARGGWQCDADIWFSSSLATATQHGDAELVIVTRTSRNHGHYPHSVWIGGRWWYATRWQTGGGHWPLMFFVPSNGATLTRTIPLPLAAFRRYMVRRGWLPASRWLDSACYGTEVWSGGRGLSDSMSVTGLALPRHQATREHVMKHCDTCMCETPADRAKRIKAEQAKRERDLREAEFVKRHSILADDDLNWARATVERARQFQAQINAMGAGKP